MKQKNKDGWYKLRWVYCREYILNKHILGLSKHSTAASVSCALTAWYFHYSIRDQL